LWHRGAAATRAGGADGKSDEQPREGTAATKGTEGTLVG
jgi:hypothetical protein